MQINQKEVKEQILKDKKKKKMSNQVFDIPKLEKNRMKIEAKQEAEIKVNKDIVLSVENQVYEQTGTCDC